LYLCRQRAIFAYRRNKTCITQNHTTMKKIFFLLALMVVTATSASAMSYNEARRHALFLADKMAYELDLTDEQYDAAYEINLDYLMRTDPRRDIYGSAWSLRNSLLRSVLSSWQYTAYAAADYFFRPLYRAGDIWRWHIYDRYARTRFYRSRPTVYISYRGGRPPRYYRDHRWNYPMRPHRVAPRPMPPHHGPNVWGRPGRPRYDVGPRHDDRRFDMPRHDNGWHGGRHHGHR
jgi:hypothetical protein